VLVVVVASEVEVEVDVDIDVDVDVDTGSVVAVEECAGDEQAPRSSAATRRHPAITTP